MADVIKIDEYTYRIEDGFVRFFLLIGEDKAALIDSGAICKNALELVKKITDKEVILVNTHGDGDHTSGTGSFDKIYMHINDYEGCGVNTKYPDTSLVALNDNDEINLGNRVLKVVHIPGHTKGSLAFIDAKNRILYSGDSVQKGHIFMFGKHRIPELFNESLDKLIGLIDEYDYIYACHDEYCLNGDYVYKVKDAWNKVLNNELTYEVIDVHGNSVKSYSDEYCGFYCE